VLIRNFIGGKECEGEKKCLPAATSFLREMEGYLGWENEKDYGD